MRKKKKINKRERILIVSHIALEMEKNEKKKKREREKLIKIIANNRRIQQHQQQK